MDKVLNLHQLAELLQITRKLLYKFISEDRYHIRSKHLFKVGSQYRIDDANYQALLDEMKEGSKS